MLSISYPAVIFWLWLFIIAGIDAPDQKKENGYLFHHPITFLHANFIHLSFEKCVKLNLAFLRLASCCRLFISNFLSLTVCYFWYRWFWSIRGQEWVTFLPSCRILTCHFTHMPFEKCVKLNLAYLKYKLLCDITARAYLNDNMLVLL